MRSSVGVRREAGSVGDSPAVILLQPLGAHGDVGRRDGTHRPTDRTQGDEGGEGRRIPDAGEINLGRVVQRSRRILGNKERKMLKKKKKKKNTSVKKCDKYQDVSIFTVVELKNCFILNKIVLMAALTAH